MTVDYLVIGQGLAGTWVSYFLEKENRSFHVIDREDRDSASRVSAGIINPVTGRRLVNSWMIEELIPFVETHYHQLGADLQVQAISRKTIADFFPTPQMRLAFTQRMSEGSDYLRFPEDDNEWDGQFNYTFGFGKIAPAFIAHLDRILPAWRNHLVKEEKLSMDDFSHEALQIHADHVRYRDIEAKKIIFCEGYSGYHQSLFQSLPYSEVKGESLIIESTDIPASHIFKKGLILAPMSSPGFFWVGSNYLWEFQDAQPTPLFREETEKLLKAWLKVPFRVLDHLAGIRPTTLERRPFVGIHPHHPSVAILNGLGTKGCSIGPFFAKQLVNHLLHDTPIQPDADLRRFHKTLADK